MTLTRCYRFSASHRLHTPLFTAEQNREVFGKCNHPHGHGHNYELEVSVSGRVDPATGRVVPVHELDELVRRHVLDRFDHANLNVDVEELRGVVPTTEMLAGAVHGRLRAHWPWREPALDAVRIRETKRNFFEYRGNRTS